MAGLSAAIGASTQLYSFYPSFQPQSAALIFLRIMYTKLQTAQLKKEFYTSLGHYMAPIPNAHGHHINWINYHTGIKHIYCRIDVERTHASIGIELTHPFSSDRMQCFATWLQLQNMWHRHVGETWHWQAEAETDGQKIISRISHSIQNVTFLSKTDWPHLISFFKPRLIAFDDFWLSTKLQFLV